MPLFLSACFANEPNSFPQQNEIFKPDPKPDPTPDPIPPSLVPIASDKTTHVVTTDARTHSSSLYSFVNHANKSVFLTEMTSLTSDCPAITIILEAAMLYSFTTPSQPNVCIYKYTVSNKKTGTQEEQTNGYNYVRITSDVNDKRAPLSLPHFSVKNKNSSPFSIDVIAKLSELKIPVAGKTLGTNIIVLGSGTAITSTSSALLFTPDPASMVSKLVYTLIDSSDPNKVDAGSIDIFIEEPNKTLPVAKNFTHNLSATIGVDMEIDVAKYITGSNPMALSSVFVLNAFATLPSTCKTCFYFRANYEGQYKLSYVISDKNQGYASAVVTINVKKPWKDITNPTNQKSFTSPLTQLEDIKKNLVYAGHDDYDNNNQIKVPRYTHQVANVYCKSLGKRLPLKKELDDLYMQRGTSLYISDQWPITSPYWISSDTKEAVSLENGALLKAVEQAFFTCTS